MKTKRIISLVVAILFFVNNISYALGPSITSGNLAEETRPGTKDAMYALGQKLFAERVGPGAIGWLFTEPLPDAFRPLDAQHVISRYIAEYQPKFIEPDYDNPPAGWRNNPILKETDLIKALRMFRNRARISSEKLEIKEGWFPVNERDHELPIARIEPLGGDEYALIVHTKFVQMWNHIRENDVWFKVNLTQEERRTVSVAWGIFYRVAKHEIAELSKRDKTFKSLGHIAYNLDIPQEDEALANEIGGNYATLNDAIWMWFLGSYCFANTTRYDNNEFLKRLNWFFEGEQALIRGFHLEFPNLLKNPGKRFFATAFACAINQNFFDKRPGAEVPETYVVKQEFFNDYAARDTRRNTLSIKEKILYATGGGEDKQAASHVELWGMSKEELSKVIKTAEGLLRKTYRWGMTVTEIANVDSISKILLRLHISIKDFPKKKITNEESFISFITSLIDWGSPDIKQKYAKLTYDYLKKAQTENSASRTRPGKSPDDEQTPPMGGGMNAEDLRKLAQTASVEDLVDNVIVKGGLYSQIGIIREELKANPEKLKAFEKLLTANIDIPALENTLKVAAGLEALHVTQFFAEKLVSIAGQGAVFAIIDALKKAARGNVLSTTQYLAEKLVSIASRDAIPAISNALKEAAMKDMLDTTRYLAEKLVSIAGQNAIFAITDALEGAAQNNAWGTAEILAKKLLNLSNESDQSTKPPMGGGMNAEDLAMFAYNNTPELLVKYIIDTGLSLQLDIVRKALETDKQKLAVFEKLLAAKTGKTISGVKEPAIAEKPSAPALPATVILSFDLKKGEIVGSFKENKERRTVGYVDLDINDSQLKPLLNYARISRVKGARLLFSERGKERWPLPIIYLQGTNGKHYRIIAKEGQLLPGHFTKLSNFYAHVMRLTRVSSRHIDSWSIGDNPPTVLTIDIPSQQTAGSAAEKTVRSETVDARSTTPAAGVGTKETQSTNPAFTFNAMKEFLNGIEIKGKKVFKVDYNMYVRKVRVSFPFSEISVEKEGLVTPLCYPYTIKYNPQLTSPQQVIEDVLQNISPPMQDSDEEVANILRAKIKEVTTHSAGQVTPKPGRPAEFGKSPEDLIRLIALKDGGGEVLSAPKLLEWYEENYKALGFEKPAEIRNSALRTIERDLYGFKNSLLAQGLVELQLEPNRPSSSTNPRSQWKKGEDGEYLFKLTEKGRLKIAVDFVNSLSILVNYIVLRESIPTKIMFEAFMVKEDDSKLEGRKIVFGKTYYNEENNNPRYEKVQVYPIYVAETLGRKEFLEAVYGSEKLDQLLRTKVESEIDKIREAEKQEARDETKEPVIGEGVAAMKFFSTEWDLMMQTVLRKPEFKRESFGFKFQNMILPVHLEMRESLKVLSAAELEEAIRRIAKQYGDGVISYDLADRFEFLFGTEIGQRIMAYLTSKDVPNNIRESDGTVAKKWTFIGVEGTTARPERPSGLSSYSIEKLQEMLTEAINKEIETKIAFGVNKASPEELKLANKNVKQIKDIIRAKEDVTKLQDIGSQGEWEDEEVAPMPAAPVSPVKLVDRAQMVTITNKNIKPGIWGTAGYRGVKTDPNDFSIDNVSRQTAGFAEEVLERISKGKYTPINGKTVRVAFAFDSRKDSDDYAYAMAKVLAAYAGFKVDILDEALPTPIVARLTQKKRAAQAYDFAFHVTPSHNQLQYGGIKLLFEGSVNEHMWTYFFEKRANAKMEYPVNPNAQFKKVHVVDELIEEYFNEVFPGLIGKFAAFKRLNPDAKFIIDLMDGSMVSFAPFFERFGIKIVRRGQMKNIDYTGKTYVLAKDKKVGFAPDPTQRAFYKDEPEYQEFLKSAPDDSIYFLIDGDGDRLVTLVKKSDEADKVKEIKPNHFGPLAFDYILANKLIPEMKRLVRTYVTTAGVDAVAAYHHLGAPTIVPVGSKYFNRHFHEAGCLEESGHFVVPGYFDDTIYQIGLILKMMSETNKNVSTLLAETQEKTGYKSVFDRDDFENLLPEEKAKFIAPLTGTPDEVRVKSQKAVDAIVEQSGKELFEALVVVEGEYGIGSVVRLEEYIDSLFTPNPLVIESNNKGIIVRFKDLSWGGARLSGTGDTGRLYTEGRKSREERQKIADAFINTLDLSKKAATAPAAPADKDVTTSVRSEAEPPRRGQDTRSQDTKSQSHKSQVKDRGDVDGASEAVLGQQPTVHSETVDTKAAPAVEEITIKRSPEFTAEERKTIRAYINSSPSPYMYSEDVGFSFDNTWFVFKDNKVVGHMRVRLDHHNKQVIIADRHVEGGFEGIDEKLYKTVRATLKKEGWKIIILESYLPEEVEFFRKVVGPENTSGWAYPGGRVLWWDNLNKELKPASHETTKAASRIKPGKSPEDLIRLIAFKGGEGEVLSAPKLLEWYEENYKALGFEKPAEIRKSALRTIERDLYGFKNSLLAQGLVEPQLDPNRPSSSTNPLSQWKRGRDGGYLFYLTVKGYEKAAEARAQGIVASAPTLTAPLQQKNNLLAGEDEIYKKLLEMSQDYKYKLSNLRNSYQLKSAPYFKEELFDNTFKATSSILEEVKNTVNNPSSANFIDKLTGILKELVNLPEGLEKKILWLEYGDDFPVTISFDTQSVRNKAKEALAEVQAIIMEAKSQQSTPAAGGASEKVLGQQSIVHSETVDAKSTPVAGKGTAQSAESEISDEDVKIAEIEKAMSIVERITPETASNKEELVKIEKELRGINSAIVEKILNHFGSSRRAIEEGRLLLDDAKLALFNTRFKILLDVVYGRPSFERQAPAAGDKEKVNLPMSKEKEIMDMLNGINKDTIKSHERIAKIEAGIKNRLTPDDIDILKKIRTLFGNELMNYQMAMVTGGYGITHPLDNEEYRRVWEQRARSLLKIIEELQNPSELSTEKSVPAPAADGASETILGPQRSVGSPERSRGIHSETVDAKSSKAVISELKKRAFKEEYSRDSLENVLNSVLEFKSRTGRYPEKVIAVGWKFKEKRFKLHAEAIGILDRFEYVGINNPPEEALQTAIVSERKKVDTTKNDMLLEGEEWQKQREKRDPFKRGNPYLEGRNIRDVIKDLKQGLLQQSSEANKPSIVLSELIIVPGHGVYIGQGKNETSEDSGWIGIFKGEGRYYTEHAQEGVRLATKNENSLLIFSGGQTREEAGARSEAGSYYDIAEQWNWWLPAKLEELRKNELEELVNAALKNRDDELIKSRSFDSLKADDGKDELMSILSIKEDQYDWYYSFDESNRNKKTFLDWLAYLAGPVLRETRDIMPTEKEIDKYAESVYELLAETKTQDTRHKTQDKGYKVTRSPGTTSQAIESSILSVISQYVIDVGLDIGPGRVDSTPQEIASFYPIYEILSHQTVEIYLPQATKGALTDAVRQEIVNLNKRIRERTGRKDDAISFKAYDGYNLGILLANREGDARRIFVNDNTLTLAFKDLLSPDKVNVFRGNRLITTSIPQAQDKKELSVYQAWLIKIALLSAMVEESNMLTVGSALQEELESRVDSDININEFITNLAGTENERIEAVATRINYFLGKIVKLSQFIGEQIRILKAFWTAA